VNNIEAEKAEVEAVLRVLLGLPLWAAGRLLDLEWFEFGARHVGKDHRGRAREVGEYALHTQCSWRIAGPEGIVVGSRDRFRPRGNPEEVPEDFDCNKTGETLCDERTEAFFSGPCKDSLIVEEIVVGDWGAFSLSLGGGFALDVFPDDSLDDENWRFFQPYCETPHFVLAGGTLKKHEYHPPE